MCCPAPAVTTTVVAGKITTVDWIAQLPKAPDTKASVAHARAEPTRAKTLKEIDEPIFQSLEGFKQWAEGEFGGVPAGLAASLQDSARWFPFGKRLRPSVHLLPGAAKVNANR